MSTRICGAAPWQTPNPVLPRHLSGLIPVTQRRSPQLAERLCARLVSPLRGDQQATAGSVMDVKVLALKGALESRCRWSPISARAQCR